MQKIFLFVLSFMLIFNISICSASKVFNSDKAAIGGISTGSSTDYIKSIYGDPNKIKVNESNPKAETWYYGDSFQIDFVDGIASSVISSGANGLSTPDGITVGMKKSKMTSKYGSPKQIDKYGKRAVCTYKTNDGIEMTFIITSGIISEIRIK